MKEIIDIPISPVFRQKILLRLEDNSTNIIEALKKKNNVFSLLSLWELHKQGKFEDFPDYFNNLLNHRKDKDISLWQGDALFIYISCLLYEQTKNESYLTTAFELVNHARLDDIYCKNSLFHGYAGLTLSLLKLAGYSNSPKLSEKINFLIEKLLNAIEYDELGISWREMNDNPYDSLKPQQIKNLCGFGTGASGIMYSFACLAETFNNKAFLNIVAQAQLRQDGLYDKEAANWPDFTLKIKSAEDHKKHVEAYKNKNQKWFFPLYHNHTLADGFIGIAMANILMFKYTNDVQQKSVYYSALNKIAGWLNEKEQLPTNLKAEIGIFLLSGYRILKDVELLSLLEKLLKKIEEDLPVALKNQTPEYIYFILSCLYPVEGILPNCGNNAIHLSKEIPNTSLTDDVIHTMLLKKVFSRTVAWMEVCNISLVKDYDYQGHLVKSFIQQIESNEPIISDSRFLDIFELELHKYRLQNQVQSKAYYFAQSLERDEKYNLLKDLSWEEFHHAELVISPECELFEMDDDWTKAADWNTGTAKKGYMLNMLENSPAKIEVILYCGNNGYVVEKPIRNQDLILIPFQEPVRVAQALIDIIASFNFSGMAEEENMTVIFRNAILINFKEGILQFN